MAGCLSNNRVMEPKNWDEYIEFRNNGYKVIELEETPEAFPNPIKGFRPGIGPGQVTFGKHEYARVYRQYVRYTDLETTSQDTVQRIIDWSNQAWAGIEKQNIKVIPRVVLTYPTNNQPGSLANNYWPSDISQPSEMARWDTQELKDRLEKFIIKLGEAWDNDPRVAAIEMGLWGYWGEHHLLSNGKIPSSVQKILGDAFTFAFRNKKVMIRYPETFTQYQFGYYWDSFALSDDSEGGYGIIRRNIWKDKMISGEVAYDWGNRSQLGRTPNETVQNEQYTNHVIGWINRIHASSLGWIADYNQNNPELKTNVSRIQKALGYRFVIRSVVYKETLSNDEESKIGFKVSNVGSAPFYYDWPVEISLLNQDHEPVYQKLINVDIRSWLPGETNTVIDSLAIPINLKNDTYIIAIAILDPAGNRPSLRFANINYFNGGRTPIGTVGINQNPEYDFLGQFDLLYNDNTLKYELN
jgi:hypothetical protein